MFIFRGGAIERFRGTSPPPIHRAIIVLGRLCGLFGIIVLHCHPITHVTVAPIRIRCKIVDDAYRGGLTVVATRVRAAAARSRSCVRSFLSTVTRRPSGTYIHTYITQIPNITIHYNMI